MVQVLLDNIRSAYNVGSVFRTCDSAGVDELLLAGYCAIPPNPKLQKTALGSMNHVAWTHHCITNDAIRYLKSQHVPIVCFETAPNPISLFEYTFPETCCMVFGNEELGIQSSTIALADVVVKIPQYGIKESLNIASAAAIAIYEYRRQHQNK